MQLQPLPYFVAPWAEALVSLTLAMEGLIVLNLVSTKLLLPMFSLHGYLLGSTFVGAEPTPLYVYFLGLLISKAALLFLVITTSQSIITLLGTNGSLLTAGIWIGMGSAFPWVGLIN